MAGEWVPIILFISFAVVMVAYLHLHFKYKQRLQDTLQLAIEKGQELSSETVDALLVKKQPFADLKRGIIFISFGIALSVFLLLLSKNEANDAFAIGTFPIIIGLGYITVWKLRPKYDV